MEKLAIIICMLAILILFGIMTQFADAFNLQSYLARINLPEFVESPPPPDVETLAKIQISHLQNIPFENLDVVHRKVISTDLNDVFNKLVIRRRGGYCFETNTLLAGALESVGFKVKSVLSRVRWNRPSDIKTALTHLILIVTTPADGKNYHVDVGFGGLQCLQPLLLENEDEFQTTPDGNYRIVETEDDHRNVQWQLKGEWIDLYTYQIKEALPCDIQVANWWTCTFPEARWVSFLFTARIIGAERHHLLNSEYVIRRHDGTATKRIMSSTAEVLLLLQDVFGIDLPTDLDASKVEAFVNRGPSSAFHSPFYIV